MTTKIVTALAILSVLSLLVLALFTTNEVKQKNEELQHRIAVLQDAVKNETPADDNEEDTADVAEKNWQGKKVLVLGDSISSESYADIGSWVTVLKKQGYFPADTNNDSLHATGFVAKYTGDDPNADNDFITRLEKVKDKETYDLVVVFGGINDGIHSIPFGESGGDKDKEFVPAVDYFFEYLVNHFTQARIVVLSPLRTHATGHNSAGHKHTDYIDYIKEVAESYCLPVLNLTDESGFCPFVPSFRDMWTYDKNGEWEKGDGVHPNLAYHQDFLVPMIKNFLNQFI